MSDELIDPEERVCVEHGRYRAPEGCPLCLDDELDREARGIADDMVAHGTEIDRSLKQSGAAGDLAIIHVAQIGGTRYCGRAIGVNADLVELGLADPRAPMVSWDDCAVVAIRAGEVVGIITWTKVQWLQEAAVKLGWVEPGHRRIGIYRRMWGALVRQARADGLRRVVGTIAAGNESMLAAASVLGRTAESVNLVYHLAEEKSE